MKHPIPRLPAFDWDTFSGPKTSTTDCILEDPACRFTVSGRASILLALELLTIGPGDKVMVPSYHCPTMVAPIAALGAQAIFYPINDSGAPDLQWIQQHLTPDIRVILVAHFFGLPQPLSGIRRWCDQQGVRLIEDCAHSLFGMSSERAVGRWGDLAIASLTKFLPVSEGGCLINNMVRTVPTPPQFRPSIKSQLKAGFDIIHSGVNHGRLSGLGLFISGANKLRSSLKSKPTIQEQKEASPGDGFTINIAQSHLDLTVASQWIAQHAPRDRIVFKRRENYRFFAQQLSGLTGMHPLLWELPENCAPYVFPLWVDQPDPGYAQLRRIQFPVSRWDRLWPTVPCIEQDFGIKWSHHVLQLACHQDLTVNEMRTMVATLKTIYATKAKNFGSNRSNLLGSD